ncbi:MAG: hypothetical protein ICV68_07710 [Pyrinomonadaceae bacterium]|nr:hypothetical protein [Pyrinomonadaceae bacterium]
MLADSGVRASVPLAEWNAFVEDIRQVWNKNAPTSALVVEINKLADLLGRYLPATADNPNEIPNRPRAKRKQKRKEKKQNEVAAR